MEKHALRGASGIALNCIDYGGIGKPPILFIHGGSAHAHWWDFVAPELTDHFHVLALDQRGHGDSQWTPEWAYGSRHYVADLENVIANWEFGAPVLIGHSMGGHTAILYAEHFSTTLRALVAIDSPIKYPPHALELLHKIAQRPPRRFDSLDEACAGFRPVPRETAASPGRLQHVAMHSFRQDSDGKWSYKSDRRTMIREPEDAGPGLSRIVCPALFARAGDGVIERRDAERIAEAMPQGQFVEIPDSHHHVMIDNPAGLVEALRTFLGTLK